MKLSEAISLREDIRSKISQLQERLLATVRVAEGRKPAEKPEKLYKEIDTGLRQLKILCVRIDATRASVRYQDKTLLQMEAEQEILTWRIEMMRQSLSKALDLSSDSNIQYVSTIDTKLIGKQINTLEELHREAENQIQALMHYTELKN